MIITIPEENIMSQKEGSVTVMADVIVVSNGEKKIIPIYKPNTMKSLNDVKREKKEMEHKIQDAINEFLEANPDTDISIDVQIKTLNTDSGDRGVAVKVKASINL